MFKSHHVSNLATTHGSGVLEIAASHGKQHNHSALSFSREARGGGGSEAPRSVYLRADRYTLGPMRTNLSVEDLGTFLDEPRVAVLATLRVDGTVLLSPVYHEWREGAFNVVIETQNVKARHLRRDPRATILVAESEPPLRGVEVRGSAQFIDDGVTETTRRIVARYGDEEAEADAEARRGADVIVRLEPDHIRIWDFADEFDAG